MEVIITLKGITNGVFFLALLFWVLKDVFKKCGEFSAVSKSGNFSRTWFFGRNNVVAAALSFIVAAALSFIVAASYLGFWVYEIWFLKVKNPIEFDALLTCLAWVLASVVSVFAERWPILVVLFWLVSALLDALSIFRIPKFLTNTFCIVDFAACPLAILLCFSALFCHSEEKKEEDNVQAFLEEVLPREDAFSASGVWSKLTFRWLNPLFEKGHVGKLELKHVPDVPTSEMASEAFASMEDSLRARKTEQVFLSSAMLQMVWNPLVLNATCAGMNTLASYVGPMLITSFVNFLSGDDLNWKRGIFFAVIMFLAKTVESLSQRRWYFGSKRIGIRVKAALMVLIYKKSLEIKYGGMSSGKITNLINVDVERIGELFWHIHGIWLLPIQVTLALIILYWNLGAAPAVFALLTTILVMISNTPLARMQENMHSKIMESRDSRIKAISETLKSMKVLKLHSWEACFLDRILNLREIEKNWLRKYLYTCSAVAFLFWASPTVISVVTFTVCILLKTPLTSGTVLSALATFRILQDPIYNLPELVSVIAQTKVSIDRVEKFLYEDDQNQNHQKAWISYLGSDSSETAVEIEPGEYSWGISSSKKPAVKISNGLRIKKGCNVVICGSVGSGKSSFLYSILGEIPRISGAGAKVNGSKAFVPQSAWIQTGTIRDNVLFGKEMDPDLYEDVVNRCCLNADFASWADRDLTIVGERGLNLSGGQKQRIQLARAIYSDSDILFLDDPFSAVDAKTGKHIFKECVMKLLNRKTVIYATHQLEFLDQSDLVLVMKDGMIVQSGRYEDLIADQEGELSRQVSAHTKTLDQVTTHQNSVKGKRPSIQTETIGDRFREFCAISSTNNNTENQREATETGRVKWKVYSTFITSAYKGALVPLMLLFHILFQGLQMLSSYWLAWGTYEKDRVSNKKLITIFALLSAASSIFVLARALLLSTVAIETSQRLFLGMMRSVFRAPFSFFDDNHSSRILGRSSTDQSTLDTDIPYRLAGLAFALIQLLSIIFLMSKVAWPVFFLFLIILAISIWYQAYYITTARELARMVGVQRAPILHHLSESVTGAATIRCFNQQRRFLEKNFGLIDEYSRVAFYNSATMEWLCVRINFLFNLVFFLLLVILVNIPRSAIDPSLAGLAAAYGLNLNVLQAWVIWNLCNVENKMISVERILQFTDLPSEAPLIIENSRPDPEWPNLGEIKVIDLQVKYRGNLPRVLKGITCTFPAQKKIGIVGRTGCGKSTLIQTLFRVVEPFKGRIVIDGIDISGIGLQDLRSKLSIIPQDPTLFQGTIRSNLDPLQQCSDSDIWEVLRKCHLSDIVNQDQRSLDAPVAEDGENWSVGQRQLVCLARALLQKRRILVLDEATASVDTLTDNLIQKTIREETSSCTVLMVAHRIPTVIDNDLVLVLGEGTILEYDSPTQLLENKASAFSSLVGEFLRRDHT